MMQYTLYRKPGLTAHTLCRLLVSLRKLKSFKCTLLLISCFFLLHSAALAQQQVLQQIANALDNYNAAGIKEKIYVHTDKNFYLSGEIMWFKIYTTDAAFHRPSTISKVAYIEVLDSANHAVLQAKVGLQNGMGSGSLALLQSIPSGNYTMRAYTRWMKNFEADYFFEKRITIVNLNKLPEKSNPAAAHSNAVSFFPEGGNLVAALPNKVAFKALNSEGQSISFIGYLLENNDTILKFEPTHAGMGHFLITPKPGYRYSAIIHPQGGKSFTQALPAAQAQGTVMQLTAAAHKLSITAASSSTATQTLYLVAHTRGAIKLQQATETLQGKASFTFNDDILDDGITQLTLFDAAAKPLCERLYFKRPEKNLNVQITTPQKVYNTRKEVNIDIAAKGITAVDSASISVAVFRLDSLQGIDYTNIHHYLLLSSDVRGAIENPEYYFTHTKEAAEAADNLMLTQGWRRFTWRDVLTGQKPLFPFAPEIRGHIVTGSVIHSLTGAEAADVKTYLSAPATITQLGIAVSDSRGNVKFEMNNFFGGNAIVAQTNPLTNDSVYRIQIHSPFSQQFTHTPVPALARPVAYPATLLKQSISMQVQHIYNADKMNQLRYPYFTDTAAFYVKPDFSYPLDAYTRFTSIEEVLREYVVLVNVRRRGGRVELPVINTIAKEYFPNAPLNLLDGVPVFDFTRFFELDPLKVNVLEVIAQRYFLGRFSFDGILNWKTYKPSLANYHFASNALVMDYEGLQADREFYAPVYDTPENTASHIPDYRSVLQWMPYVSIQGTHSSTIKLFTSDLAGKYAVVAEGLSANGTSGGSTLVFEVQ